ncbi:hypothetical protein HDV05_000884 [Chytridiales sp. JEL 0842]|nr:hypothetical protein HDV05_000884 [Chytridiales sp. JEL 0842]
MKMTQPGLVQHRISTFLAPLTGLVFLPVILSSTAYLNLRSSLSISSFKPSQQVILITGASAGIGKALAQFYARKGAIVVLLARRKEVLERVERECKDLGAADVDVQVADVTDEEGVRVAMQRVGEKYGRIDVLILNAGVYMHRRIAHMSDSSLISQTMDVNFLGCVKCTIHAVPWLKKSKRGKVVGVSSGFGVMAGPMCSGNRLGDKADDKDPIKSEMTADEFAGIVDLAIRRRAYDWVAVFGLKVVWYIRDYFPTLLTVAMRSVLMPPETTNKRLLTALFYLHAHLRTFTLSILSPPTTFQYVLSETKLVTQEKKAPGSVGVVVRFRKGTEGEEGGDRVSVKNDKDALRMIEDVASLACWCLTAGSERLTVYDRDGVLKKNDGVLCEALAKAIKSFFTTSISNNDVDEHNTASVEELDFVPNFEIYIDNLKVSSASTTSSEALLRCEKDQSTTDSWENLTDNTQTENHNEGEDDDDSGISVGKDESEYATDSDSIDLHPPELSTAGIRYRGSRISTTKLVDAKPTRTLQIHLTSYLDGKGRLTSLTQSLALQSLAHPIKGELHKSITVSKITDLWTKGETCLVEPQLVFSFSEGNGPLMLDGYSPWDVRLTEFWNVPGNRRITYQDFLMGLARYSCCVQRFGK